MRGKQLSLMTILHEQLEAEKPYFNGMGDPLPWEIKQAGVISRPLVQGVMPVKEQVSDSNFTGNIGTVKSL